MNRILLVVIAHPAEESFLMDGTLAKDSAEVRTLCWSQPHAAR